MITFWFRDLQLKRDEDIHRQLEEGASCGRFDMLASSEAWSARGVAKVGIILLKLAIGRVPTDLWIYGRKLKSVEWTVGWTDGRMKVDLRHRLLTRMYWFGIRMRLKRCLACVQAG